LNQTTVIIYNSFLKDDAGHDYSPELTNSYLVFDILSKIN